MEHTFIEFCKNGDINSIRTLINAHRINIHMNNEIGFRCACYYGHLHIVEYLTNLYKINPNYNIINIHADNESGFGSVCFNWRIDIVEYLINLHKENTDYMKINIHVNDEYIFRRAYIHGYIHIMKYLINLYKNNVLHLDCSIINIHKCYERLSWLDLTHVAKYLLSIGGYTHNYHDSNILL